MNVDKLKALIPASFAYEYIDNEGNEAKETVAIKLNRLSFSTARSEAFKTALEDQDAEAISQTLSDLIAEWDVTAGTEPFPPTTENLLALPFDFVMQLAGAVFEKLTPNPPKAETSPDGSAPEETGMNSMAISETATAS